MTIWTLTAAKELVRTSKNSLRFHRLCRKEVLSLEILKLNGSLDCSSGSVGERTPNEPKLAQPAYCYIMRQFLVERIAISSILLHWPSNDHEVVPCQRVIGHHE